MSDLFDISNIDTNNIDTSEDDNSNTDNTDSSIPTPDENSSPMDKFFLMVYRFLMGFIQNFIHLLIVIIMGVVILWGCKVSQASLLPTDIHCYPYEEKKYEGATFMPTSDSDTFDININLKKIEDILMSEKIMFPYKDCELNQKNMLIDFLRSLKFAYWNKGTIEYFLSIIESLIVTNYSIQNTFFLILNKYLNEPLIVLLAPYFMPPYFMLMGIYNYIFLIYLWFSNMGWLFTKNINTEKKGRPDWKVCTLRQDGFFTMIVCLIIVWVYFLIFLFGNFFLFPIVILFVMLYCLLSIVSYSAKIKRIVENEKGEPVEKTLNYGILEMVKDFLKYKKHFILGIVTYQLLLGVGRHFGFSSLALCAIGVILLYFYTDLYKAIVPDYLSEAIDNYNFTANKKCPDNGEFYKKQSELMKIYKNDNTVVDEELEGEEGEGEEEQEGEEEGEEEEEYKKELKQEELKREEKLREYQQKIEEAESNKKFEQLKEKQEEIDKEADTKRQLQIEAIKEENKQPEQKQPEHKQPQHNNLNDIKHVNSLIKSAKTLQQHGGKKLVKTIKELSKFLGRDNSNKSLSKRGYK